VIEGGAPGADRQARLWAANQNIPVDTYPADWKRWGRSAGSRRNADMLQAGAEAVLAFPGGPGTADMVYQAQQSGIPVWAMEDFRTPVPHS